MTDTHQETEIKLYTPDLSLVQKHLELAGAVLTHERVFERNVRYEDVDESLQDRGIVVRLREDSRIRLTYKGAGRHQGTIISREELEVEVSDFATMEMILSRLGYHPYMIYEKYRTTYTLSGAEIVLDEMPYGNFTEIEADPATIKRLIRKLRLEDAKRLPYSYATLFDFVKYNLGLIFDDLTFANFADITVDKHAFRRVE